MFGAAGQLQNQAYGYLFPIGPFYAFLHAIGIAPWEIQRAFEAAIVCAAFLGTYRLLRRMGVDAFWPAVGDPFFGPSNGEPMVDVMQPGSGDIRSAYDVPWDWAHRYPPAVMPSHRPYVPSCPSETVTVPGRHGEPQTVNVMRCY